MKSTEKLIKERIKALEEENKRYKKLFEGKERFSKIIPDDMDFIIMSKTDYDRQVDDIELVALELRSRIDKAIDYGNNCLENLKDQEDYLCESIDIVGLLQMIHKNYIKILKGEDNE